MRRRSNRRAPPGAASCTRGGCPEEKGVETLVRAAPSVAAPIDVVGDGPERAGLERSGRAPRSAERVLPRSREPRCRARARSECSPSRSCRPVATRTRRWGSSRRSRAGCPSSGPSHGGIPELIEPGVNGDLVAPGDERALARSPEPVHGRSRHGLRARRGGPPQGRRGVLSRGAPRASRRRLSGGNGLARAVVTMRIAMIGQRGIPATFGGVEHHVEELGSRLAERGHHVTVYSRANYTTIDTRPTEGCDPATSRPSAPSISMRSCTARCPRAMRCSRRRTSCTTTRWAPDCLPCCLGTSPARRSS